MQMACNKCTVVTRQEEGENMDKENEFPSACNSPEGGASQSVINRTWSVNKVSLNLALLWLRSFLYSLVATSFPVGTRATDFVLWRPLDVPQDFTNHW